MRARRIDLLALDKSGRLVVIEIKRTDDGGHMELQSIRYAAMVSSMEFTEVLEAYSAHCAKNRPQENVDARGDMESFLEMAEGAEDPAISTDVRIILVSADFGREITTAVLWLNGFEGMDIRCVRLVPYEVDGKMLLDIQQVLPLPEAADYQVRLRKKDAARERARRESGKDYTRYHIIVDGTELLDQNKRNAMRVMIEQLSKHGASLSQIHSLVPKRMKVLMGRFTHGDQLEGALRKDDPRIDLKRWFTQYPFVDEVAGHTYVLSKMWGAQTGSKLAELAQAFPDTKVTFRVADPES